MLGCLHVVNIMLNAGTLLFDCLFIYLFFEPETIFVGGQTFALNLYLTNVKVSPIVNLYICNAGTKN